jgi:hypothetical protein
MARGVGMKYTCIKERKNGSEGAVLTSRKGRKKGGADDERAEDTGNKYQRKKRNVYPPLT